MKIRLIGALCIMMYVGLHAAQPEKIVEAVVGTLARKPAGSTPIVKYCTVDDAGDFWLSWEQFGVRSETDPYYRWHEPPPYRSWYVQKFNSKGKAYFPAIEVQRSENPLAVQAWEILAAYDGDAYVFPGISFSLMRIDEKGKVHASPQRYRLLAEGAFIDRKDNLYVFGHDCGEGGSGNRRVGPPGGARFKVQEPLPLFMEKTVLPAWYDSAGYRYSWITSNLSYCSQSSTHALFIKPPSHFGAMVSDTSRISVYRVSLPDLMTVDTSSFRISQAMFKRIRGCKTAPSELIEGSGDTLVLYVPSQGVADRLIYVCKLTKQGKPIRANSVIDEQVKDFKQAPRVLRQKVFLRGGVVGIREPTGILIYGFDGSGNVYYHLWDKSDKYWREE